VLEICSDPRRVLFLQLSYSPLLTCELAGLQFSLNFESPLRWPFISTFILFFNKRASYVMRYYWCSIILIYFPSFPKFHSVVPLLQTYSISAFIYDHACFCVYLYLLDLFSIYERKHVAFNFRAWLTSLNMNHMSLFFIPLCVYATFSWSSVVPGPWVVSKFVLRLELHTLQMKLVLLGKEWAILGN
jgi:hypothetical protein